MSARVREAERPRAPRWVGGPATGGQADMDRTIQNSAETALGYAFKDPSLLELALTHASVSEDRLRSNERMEFLGDSVLGLVVCEMLYERFPNLLEGEMTKIKSTIVSRRTCAMIASRLGLSSLLALGKGMQGARPETMPSSLAAAVFEAVIAAIYLDGGCDAAKKFLRPLLLDLVDRAAVSGHQHNYKSVLQQHAQQAFSETPSYKVLDEKGPDHAKCFKVCVEVGGKRFEPCWGQSKKQAEQEAALIALHEMGLVTREPDGEVRVIKAAEI